MRIVFFLFAWYTNAKEVKQMLHFKRLDITQADQYRTIVRHAAHRGCSYSFANVYMWGRQTGTFVGDHLVLFSHFDGHSMYPFPIGPGDPKQALDAIIADARARGIPCRITGMTEAEKNILENDYPGLFRYHCDRSSFDYVYDIHDLADLKGRKYQQKRNHTNRFYNTYPDYEIRVLGEANFAECKALTDAWYARKQQDDPLGDLLMEQNALRRAYKYYDQLGMIGIALYAQGKMVAMTMASFLDEETLDVHFEKADVDVPGAYATINREFAKYVRDRYPNIRFLNREDDTGNAGLRQAKLSYHPHHMVEKCWALLREEEFDD